MKMLEDRIRKDGIVREGNVLKVDSFINHQMDIPLFRPGFRMVIFSVLLMVCVLFWRHGIMGTREFSWQKAINFVKNPLGFIKRKGAAQ